MARKHALAIARNVVIESARNKRNRLSSRRVPSGAATLGGPGIRILNGDLTIEPRKKVSTVSCGNLPGVRPTNRTPTRIKVAELGRTTGSANVWDLYKHT